MGIRLNMLDNPALRAGFRPIETLRPDVAVGANRAAPGTPAGEPARPPRPDAVTLANTATRPADNAANARQPLLMTPPTNEEILADTQPPSIAEANAQANRTEEADGAPALRLRDFRFLTAAGSARESDLAAQRDQLEQRLETASNRLEFANSMAVRIDAQLRLARLERDLDLVASEIRRLRLERAFERPSVSSTAIESARQTAQAAQAAAANASEPQSAEGTGDSILNLLA